MRCLVFLLSFLLIHLSINHVASIAVMSVDLGSEWIKIGIVSPGVPMEIALNKESKRKTPSVISFRDNVRLFGEDAQNIALRFPNQAYSYLLDLVGKTVDHPLVKLYQRRFPHYEIIPDTERGGTVLFKQDNDTVFTPEELIAQILQKAKEFAENAAHQSIKECVITVPGFFNQVERKALLQAAELADLKVLQLINDYTAVALNYGIFRAKSFNETAQYVLFYDMGASSTSATLVSFQTVKVKDRGFVETHPQLTILGVGYDRTLGGLEIQLRLRDYLAKKFNEMKKTKNDIFQNPRAMAKLFKEAGRLKNVLSANAEHYAQVEGLIDEQDYKLLVTRDQLENLIKDLLDRIARPVEQALKTAHLTIDIVNQVVLVGAGTRMPKIQEILQKTVDKELSKNLNADEAAAMGAVYKAAALSTGFKVTKFITKDAIIFPIQIIFQRQTDESTVKTVKRTLFGLMNPYPQRKIITFNKHTDDFNFSSHYTELEYLPYQEILNLGSHNLSKYDVSGVADALKRNQNDNSETKGIKAHFNIDESGVLNMINIELAVEKTVIPTEDEGTLSKLGSTFSKFFGSNDKLPVDEQVADEKPVHEIHDDEKETSKSAEEEKINVTTTSDAENATVKESLVKNTTEKDEKKDLKPKTVVIKEPLKAAETILSLNPLNKKQIENSLEKIKHFDKIEKDLNKRATALNNLESFIIDVQNKLFEDDYIQASSDEEVETIRKTCSELSDWLYDDGADADAVTYEKKLDEIRALTKDLFSRVWEQRERPEALKALDSMLNHSTTFLKTAKNLTESSNPEKAVFRDTEIDALEKLIDDIIEWKNKSVEEQKGLKASSPPKLTVKVIMDKMAALDREVKYLLNKLRYFKPKKADAKQQSGNSNEKENSKNEEKKEPEVMEVSADDDNNTDKGEDQNVFKIPLKKIKTEEINDKKKKNNVDLNDEEDDDLHQEL